MKAQLYNKIQLLSDIHADFEHYSKIIYKGMEGVIIECYENPEYYAVDIAIPNPNLVGGFEYDNIMLKPEQFKVINSYSNSASIEITSF